MLSAPLLVVPSTETVALIRTASGTTVVVPVALIVMNRVSAADAGVVRAIPEKRQQVMKPAMSLCTSFSIMQALLRKKLSFTCVFH